MISTALEAQRVRCLKIAAAAEARASVVKARAELRAAVLKINAVGYGRFLHGPSVPERAIAAVLQKLSPLADPATVEGAAIRRYAAKPRSFSQALRRRGQYVRGLLEGAARNEEGHGSFETRP